MSDASPDLVLVLITALWGTTFAIIQVGLAHSGTFSFLALRFAIGAAAVALLARFKVWNWASNRAGLALGSLSFLGFGLQTGGLRWTTASRSAFITGLTVILVPLADGLLGRRQSRWMWAALLLALVGLALLTEPLSGAGSSTLKGDLMTLACAFAFGASLLASERVAPRHPVFPLVFGHIVAMGLWSALTASLAGWDFESCPALWASGLFCGVVASAVCIAAQMWAMQRTLATRAALIFALEPVFAAGFAYAWQRQVLRASEVVGGALIVAAASIEPLRLMLARGPTSAA